MYSYSLFIMDNFLRTALDDTWMGVRLTFRPEHLSPSFTTMNKIILVTCEYSRYLISSRHVVFSHLIQIFSTFTGVARVSSVVNSELSSNTIKSPDDHDNE